MVSEEKFREIVDDYVAPLMDELGFARKKKSWFYAVEGECTKRVACGFDKSRGQDAGSIVVTVCVGFKALEVFLSECRELASHVSFDPTPMACTMASNLGHLREPFRYLSWEITPESDAAKIGADICTRIKTDGLKFFEGYGSLERAVSAWRSGVRHNLGNMAVLYLAAYEWLYGSRERALFDLKDAVISADLPSTRNIYTCLLNHLEQLQASPQSA